MTDTLYRRYYVAVSGVHVQAGFATPEMIEAIADPATDRCVVIDSLETVVTPENRGDPSIVPPLREVRIEPAKTAREFDELATRYRKALAKAMRGELYPALARLLDAVTVMNPERDRLAWRIHDTPTSRTHTVVATAMQYLPEVWERSADLDDLTEMVTELEKLYPPTES